MKKFLTTLFAIVLLSASIAQAEIKTYTGSGEYLLTDENISFAKSRAEISAERNILDKVCVYVRANSTVIDNEFGDDEVVAICAGILHVTDTKFKIVDDADGILVTAIITAQVDVDELETLLKRAIAERK
ncbi:MAG: hypothetical protein IKN27_08790 [Selenomonadaceae bacterium]|nr:hypothetical protein [Selenomonadaceae bacterium]